MSLLFAAQVAALTVATLTVATFQYVFAQTTAVSCDTFGSRNNISSQIICPNEAITCKCESDDTHASFFYWSLPIDCCKSDGTVMAYLIRLNRNYNQSKCYNKFGYCTSNTANVTAKNRMLDYNNVCNTTEINITSTVDITFGCALSYFINNSTHLGPYSNITLQIPGKPEPPQVSISNTTNASITVDLNTTDATINKYEVTISKNSHLMRDKQISGTGHQSVVFDGLNSSTNYSIQAYAINCANNVSDGTISTHCTRANPPDSIRASIMNSSIYIRWNDLGQCTKLYKIWVTTENGMYLGPPQYQECCYASQSITYNSKYYLVYVSALNGEPGAMKVQQDSTIQPTWHIIVSVGGAICVLLVSTRALSGCCYCYYKCKRSTPNSAISTTTISTKATNTTTLTTSPPPPSPPPSPPLPPSSSLPPPPPPPPPLHGNGGGTENRKETIV